MKVVSANDDGSLHLHFQHHSTKDSSSDAYISSEGALPVNVVAFDSLEDGIQAEFKSYSLAHN